MLFYMLIVVAVILLFFIIVMLIDGNRFVIREYTIENEKIKDGIDVAVMADLHNKQYGVENTKLLAALNKLNPHVVMVAGDMLTAKPGKGYERAASFMEKVAENFAVYYGLGNHEYRMKIYPENYGTEFSEYVNRLKKAGIQVLDNESALIQVKREQRMTNIRVSGLSIERFYYKRFRKIYMSGEYVDSLIGKAEKEAYQILLAHNPEYFDTYAVWGADLTLSGHVHGGIMRLPVFGGVLSPKLVFFPKYDGGHFAKNGSHMVLSRGLGMHTIPIRIFNPAELVIVHLRPKR
jgi:predicted MPP superfamily phosphohydrolase